VLFALAGLLARGSIRLCEDLKTVLSMQRAEVVHEIKHTHIVEVAEVESKDH
jgi:hypothetical protein